MKHEKWIEHFRRNRFNRPEPDWAAPITMTAARIRAMIPSLEQFRLGDGGGPASLIAHNAEKYRGSSDEIRMVVDLWFNEEKEHARLLGRAVDRFRGRLIESHWSFTAFCASRRILGVRFELQVLLLTEIVSTGYYRLLRRHADDVAIHQMCSLILRDEAGHVAFHRDRLAATGRRSFGIRHLFWRAQFWLCGLAAGSVLWSSHGKCLTTLGGGRSEYFREIRLEIAKFIRRLGAPRPASSVQSTLGRIHSQPA
jgi:hypothetical protein